MKENSLKNSLDKKPYVIFLPEADKQIILCIIIEVLKFNFFEMFHINER